MFRYEGKIIMAQGLLHRPGWFKPFQSCVRLSQMGPVHLAHLLLLTHQREETHNILPLLELAAGITDGQALGCKAQPPKMSILAASFYKRGGVKLISETAMLSWSSCVFWLSPSLHQALPANLYILLPEAPRSSPFPQNFLSVPSVPVRDGE